MAIFNPAPTAVELQAPAIVLSDVKNHIKHDQICIDCIMQHNATVTAEQISTWENEDVMKTLHNIANEFYQVGNMTNDDGQAYGLRYSKALPDACRIALKWVESSTDQSSRLWSQWTTAEV